MSLLLLKFCCLHDEVQSPLHSKQILSRTFPENLGKVTRTFIFHQADIPCTPMELPLLISPVTPHHQSQIPSQFLCQWNFQDPSTQLVILSLLVSSSLWSLGNLTQFLPSSWAAPSHYPRIQSLNLFFSPFTLIPSMSTSSIMTLNPIYIVRSVKCYSPVLNSILPVRFKFTIT